MSKIIKLETENVKRVRAVSITPTEPVVVIGGANGNGKSSVLDSIAFALGGNTEIPDQPLRRGEKNGKIVLETEDLIITRRFTPKSNVLEVAGKDGSRFASPQAVLDKLCSRVSFDPFAFVRLGDSAEGRRAQLKQLQELVGIDTVPIDTARRTAYDDRTAINREIKRQQAVVEALPSEGPEPVKMDDLISELEKIETHNRQREEMDRAHQRLDTHAADLEQRVGLIDQKIEGLKKEIDGLTIKRAETQKAYAAACDEADTMGEKLASVPVINPEPIRQKMRECAEINRLASGVEKRAAEQVVLNSLVAQSEKRSSEIDELDAQRQKMIEQVKFPIPKLGVSDSGITYDGLPLNQASSAEQLRVGLAISIAMNPKLKVMLIRDGSLLDENSMAIIEEMAVDSGAQVWIEKVSTVGSECTVIIEDGMIRED